MVRTGFQEKRARRVAISTFIKTIQALNNDSKQGLCNGDKEPQRIEAS